MADLKSYSRVARLIFPVMGLAWGATSYFYMKWNVPVYGALLAVTLACVFAADYVTCRQRMRPKKKAAVHAAILTACFGVVYFALSFLVNNVIWGGGKSYLTILALLVPFLASRNTARTRHRKRSIISWKAERGPCCAKPSRRRDFSVPG